MKTSITLFSGMDAEQISVVGCPVHGPGWNGPTNGLTTFAIVTQNFQGRLYIEASLALTPGDADWFAINAPAAGFPYTQYPRFGYGVGESSTIAFSTTLNCIWLRARVDRSYLIDPSAQPAAIGQYGRVDLVQVKY